MTIKISAYLVPLCLFMFFAPAKAQTVPVGLLDNSDDYFRRQQLLGKDSSSFMIRPITNAAGTGLNKEVWSNANKKIVLYALPVLLQQQYNTDHPYGMNDGAMIQARGYQTLFSAGIAAKIGPLTIQFRPEYVYAENKDFRTILEAPNSSNIKELNRALINTIDLPERFGNQSYSKLNLGQSSIRLNAGPVSAGLSNENLWWGPGTRNSLLMTNNASGFKHFTLNTARPVKTLLGSFEAQLIGGKLEASGIDPEFTGYRPKPVGWRYISGIVATYQPKWIPGLFLGFDRSFIIYRFQMGNGFDDYFPVFSGITKNSFNVEGGGPDEEDTKTRDQRISLFARYVLPETGAEVYFQYGREDHSKNLRDVITEPEHTRAYIAGFRKLIKLVREDEYIQVGFELTKMESASNQPLRRQGYWYRHSQVRDGYTQQGQVLGAGIGPGSNLQTLEINWVKGWNRIGIRAEHYENNYSLYDADLASTKAQRNPWSDFGLTANYDKAYEKFLFNAQLTYIKSNNYQWVLPENGNENANNLQLRVGILYRW
ncbi:capsule assembly Wzi family protein [Pedobacter metabolipauper]|uniref:Capsule assembly protein Wzi n=1 Tax=Pedobacter metabolipauper TaxID=425513 RepID=A0A4R6SWX9_9SPHI|nr:capsule assembly Wzi family protein [Pedobacter metabolipauper]TDQ09916.1 capsule assembly protein Wzi [Pedobacter metabolipauper]